MIAGALPYNLDSATAGRPTMLQFCCRRELEMAVELLLEAGCNPNETSANDVTPPLIIAAFSGNVRILNSLAAHRRTQINLIDNSGSKQTALHKVAQRLKVDRNRFLQCLNILLDPQAHRKKINVNAQDTSGNTPLHYAAQTGLIHFIVIF
jgi:ankyrin repeat protein